MKTSNKCYFGIQQFPILTAEECHLAEKIVFQHIAMWRPGGYFEKNNEMAAFTLGVNRFSMRDNLIEYEKIQQEIRKSIWNDFHWLFEKFKLGLESHFKEKFILSRKRALPGFIIIWNKPGSKFQPGDWHFDVDYLIGPWQKPIFPGSGTMSLTLPLAIPKTGAGIDFIDTQLFDFMSTEPEQENQSINNKKIVTFPHRLGQVLTQSGQFMHRIGRSKDSSAYPRITLQCLAVKQSKTWEVFW